jgi:hypothetical protein
LVLVLVGMIVGVSVSMFVSMLMSFGRIRLHPYRLLCSICGLLSGLVKGLRLYASQRLAQGYLE